MPPDRSVDQLTADRSFAAADALDHGPLLGVRSASQPSLLEHRHGELGIAVLDLRPRGQLPSASSVSPSRSTPKRARKCAAAVLHVQVGVVEDVRARMRISGVPQHGHGRP
jgi:hypothetical protein